MHNFCPTKIKFQFQMPLAWARAQGLTPYMAAIWLSVSPGRTQWQGSQLPEGGMGCGWGCGFQPPGMHRTVPARSRLGFQMPLACIKAWTETP
jgi:hypothetical protein